ncbi:MAG: hypothetical protein GY926_03490, partial [bacterium]|nr:hypothetical protein [bacterium]
HVRGVRRVDGALIAVGVLTTSAGLGTMLNLIGGRTDLTVGVATLTMVSVMIGVIAAAMAFLDALERHDLGRDAQRLDSRSAQRLGLRTRERVGLVLFFMRRRPPRSTRFPYSPLCRSNDHQPVPGWRQSDPQS